MTISKAQRQRGLNYAKALSDLATKAPTDDLKKQTYAIVNNARKEFGYKWDTKLTEVLRCVKLGASTVADLLRETPFNKQDLQQLLRELKHAGHIRVDHAQTNNTGPYVAHYYPVNDE